MLMKGLVLLCLVASVALGGLRKRYSCSPPIFASNSSNVPFSESEVELMRSYFVSNLNYGGNGAVLASPDPDVLSGQGGSYRYHWSRDAALSMRTFLMTFVNGVTNSSLVDPYFRQYISFIIQAHNQTDPFGEEILTEPKFLLNGQVYPKGWCRPQNDGPSLRASTLIMYAHRLIQNGETGYVKQYLWTGDDSADYGGVIKRDLDWVANGGWSSNTCDLWEERQSTDFFWNAMAHNRALFEGAKFAAVMGDQASAARYSQAQQQVAATLMGHWNGNFVEESSDHQMDSAVLAAFNDGVADDMTQPFTPTSEYVAGTISALVDAFCSEYPINDDDTRAGVPGVMVGRYPNDQYGGGNPWILLTNHLALLFYRGASLQSSTAELPSPAAMKHWRKLMPHLPADDAAMDAQSFSAALLSAGDGVLQRIRYHVVGDHFHLSEQLDKETGYEISAYDLSWSYGTVFKALYYRNLASANIEKMQKKKKK